MIQKTAAVFFAVCCVGANAFALGDADLLSSQIQKLLREKIPYAEIKIPSLEKLVKNPQVSAISELSSVRILEDRANGVVLLELTGAEGETVKIQTPYQALVKTPVAIRRIYPNTRLKKEDFKIETLNVASGTAHDYRNSIVYDESKLHQMETKQTILEGQFVVENAVQKQPDLRRGETVKLELLSGDLTLTTGAVVQENGSVGDRIHVITAKSKRDVVGKIREDRTVEVAL